jgi:protein-S-isoprenylcysteine O-methyltransferase Ste14
MSGPPPSSPTLIAFATLAGVVLCWIVFGCIFLMRKRPPQSRVAKRNQLSLVGIALQICAFALVWSQPPWQPILPQGAALSGIGGIVFCVFTVGLAAASTWLAGAAMRTLGKQWAWAARLVEGHQLITDGPYAYVRNPIYTGMLGMLMATGLATEHWVALIAALIIFVPGLLIRIRSEEKLLRAAFGAEFEEYAKRVPAVLPGIY